MTLYNSYNDEKLVTLLQGNDRLAFETLYHRYVNDLFQYARRNIQLKEDCEEIIQDIFVSLWSRRHALRADVVIRAYLFSMVRYNIIRYVQRSKVKRRYEEHYKLFEVIYEMQPEPLHDATDSINTALEKGLAKLPVRCGVAVKLRLEENLTNTEIASRMNISKSTVENYMVTALKQLRQMARDGGLPESIYFKN